MELRQQQRQLKQQQQQLQMAQMQMAAQSQAEAQAREQASVIAAKLYPGDPGKADEILQKMKEGISPQSYVSQAPAAHALAQVQIPGAQAADVADLQRRLTTATRLAADADDLRAAKARVETELASERGSAATMRAEKASLESKVADLERAVENKKAEIARLLSSAMQAGSPNCITEADKTALNDVIEDLRRKLAAAEGDKVSAMAALATAEQQRDNAVREKAAEVTAKEAALADAVTAHSAKDAETANRSADAQTFAAERAKAQQDLETAKKEAQKIRADCDALVRDAEQKKKDAEDAVAVLQAKLDNPMTIPEYNNLFQEKEKLVAGERRLKDELQVVQEQLAHRGKELDQLRAAQSAGAGAQAQQTTAIQELEKKVAELNAEITASKDKLRDNAELLKNKERETNDLNGQIVSMDTRIKGLESTISAEAQAQAQLQAQHDALATDKSTLQAEVGKLNAAIAAHISDIATKQSEIERLTREVSAITSSISAKQAEVDTLTALVKDKDAELARKDGEISSLGQRITAHGSATDANVESERRLKDAALGEKAVLKQEYDALAVERDQLLVDKSALESAKKGAERQRDEAASKVSELEKAVTELQTKVTNLEAQITTLAGKLSAAETRVSALETDVHDRDTSLLACKSQVTDLRDKLIEEKDSASASQKSLEESETKLQATKQELSDARTAAADAATAAAAALAAKQRELDDATAAAAATATAAAAAVVAPTHGTAVQAAIDELSRAKTELQEKLTTALNEKQALDTEKEALQKEKTALETKITALQTKLDEQKQDLEQRLQIETDAHVADNTSRDATILARDATIARLEREIGTANAEINTLNGNISTLKLEIESLKGLSKDSNRIASEEAAAHAKQLAAAREELRKCTEESSKCAQDLGAAAGKVTAASERITNLEAEATARQESIRRMADRITALEQDVRDLTGAKKVCETALEKMRNDASAADTDLKGKITALEENVKRIQKVAEQKQDSIAALELEKKKLEEAAAAAEEALDKERDKLQKLTEEHAKAVEAATQSKSLEEGQAKRIQELQTELEGAKKSNEALEEDKSALQKSAREQAEKDALEIEKLKKEASELHEKIADMMKKMKTLEEPKPCGAVVEMYRMILDSIDLEVQYFDKVAAAITKIRDDGTRQSVQNDLRAPANVLNNMQTDYVSNAPSDLENPTHCETLQQKVQDWQYNNGSVALTDVHKALLNIFEDGVGAVRVYVRIKLLADKRVPAAKIVVNPDTAMVTLGKQYGPFYSVFTEDYGNVGLYAGTNIADANGRPQFSEPDDKVQGMYTLFSQMQDGYTVVLFGYGLSGSGKSYTLFGTTGVPGIVQIGLEKMQNVSSLKVASVLELYTNKTTNQDNIQGQIHTLYTDSGTGNKLGKTVADYIKAMGLTKTEAANIKMIVDESAAYKKSISTLVPNIEAVGVDDINNLVAATEKYRLTLSKEKRVKATPLNKESSRSHLIYIFRAMFYNSKNIGHLIVMDMAGKEDPNKYKSIFLKNPSVVSMGTLMGAGIENNPAVKENFVAQPTIGGVPSPTVYNIKDVVEMLREGIYINETIFQLSCFLVKQSGGSYKPPVMKDVVDSIKAQQTEAKRVEDAKRLQELPKLFEAEVNKARAQAIASRKTFTSTDEEAIRKRLEDQIKSRSVVVDYSPAGALADPNAEYNRIENVAAGKPVPKTSLQKDITGMLPILFMFRGFSAPGKPTKFVMTCNVRQELEFADQTENTLQFANTVKST